MSDIHDRLLRLAQQLEDQHAPQHMTILMREAANRLSNHRKETLDYLGQVGQLSEEITRLRAALRDDPTPEQVADACLSFRHDYGLMPKVDRARLAWEATEWLRAWQKTFACTALGEKP